MATVKLPAQIEGEKSEVTPVIAGTRSGALIVVGTGRTMWSDLAALSGFDAHVMAVNMAGVFLQKKPDHWGSMHGEKFQWWLPLMHDQEGGVSFSPMGLNLGKQIEIHSDRGYVGVKHVWPHGVVPTRDGGSGLWSIRVGLKMGYSPVVMAGMPLDDSGHFYDEPGKAQATHGMFLSAFKQAVKDEFRGRVHSMSGASRDVVGAP